MGRGRFAIGCWSLLAAVMACKDEGAGGATKAVIGPGGGEIRAGGATLSFPPGALPTDVEISIGSTGAPEGASAFSSVYTFGPAGLTFDVPVTVAIGFSAGAINAAMLWSDDGVEWIPLETELSAGQAVASIDHFSRGFVADETVTFPGFGEDGGGGACGATFDIPLWVCMRDRCMTQYLECFGPESLDGSAFDGPCAAYGICICDCQTEAECGTCAYDEACEACDLDSGLLDCLMTECSDTF